MLLFCDVIVVIGISATIASTFVFAKKSVAWLGGLNPCGHVSLPIGGGRQLGAVLPMLRSGTICKNLERSKKNGSSRTPAKIVIPPADANEWLMKPTALGWPPLSSCDVLPVSFGIPGP